MRAGDLLTLIRRGPLALYMADCRECGRLIAPWSDSELCFDCAAETENPYYRAAAIAHAKRPLDPPRKETT